MGKKQWLILVKLGVSLVLIAALILSQDFEQLWSLGKTIDARWILLAFGIQILAKFAWVRRWQLFLQAHGIDLGFWELMKILFVGLFFNNFLPTGFGGDAIRGFYTARTKAELGPSYFAVFGERFVGVMVLALVAFLSGLIGQVFLGIDSTVFESVTYLSLGFIVTAFLGYGYLISTDKPGEAEGRSRWFRKVRSSLKDLVNITRSYPDKLARIWAHSLIVQMAGIVFYYCAARSVQIDLPFVYFCVVIPATVFVANLPISMNGLGVREGMLVLFMTPFGVSAESAVVTGLLALAITVAVSLIGGLMYFTLKEEAVHQWIRDSRERVSDR